MLGQMMTMPLLISSLLTHAETYHGDTTIASVETSGGVVYKTWSEIAYRARQLANALTQLGIQNTERCATLAWNNHRHLEIYFGVSGSGKICHTINPRLFPAQITYIANHAQDQILFFDKTFLPLLVGIKECLTTVKYFVLLSPRDEEALAQFPTLLFYDELLAQASADYQWPLLDENSASSLCYTSGTTGDPKGVLYSHRSTLLHSFGIALPDSMHLSAQDNIMPVVPMFHVNAWGTPYAAAMVGARLTMPGPNLDGMSLAKLIESEHVTIALGVPTIWQNLLLAMEKTQGKFTSLKRTVIGGAACPPSMIATFREKYGVETIHAWGMTELSPVGTINQLLYKHHALPDSAQQQIRNSQGRPPFGIELRITDDDHHSLPLDGKTQGNLQARGHWVIERYFNSADSALEDGWFTTGDVATVDQDGFMTIRDRAKDIIKSGGEWISTVELENIAVSHPSLVGAAAIAAKHDKWDERPLLIAVKREGVTVTAQEILSFFEGKVAKWQIPDDVIFVESLPLNATGKLMKNKLRELYGSHYLNS